MSMITVDDMKYMRRRIEEISPMQCKWLFGSIVRPHMLDGRMSVKQFVLDILVQNITIEYPVDDVLLSQIKLQLDNY